MMSTFIIRAIPYVELLLVLAMLLFGYLGYLDLQGKTNQHIQSHKFALAGKWALPGLLVLALLSIILLFVISFLQE